MSEISEALKPDAGTQVAAPDTANNESGSPVGKVENQSEKRTGNTSRSEENKSFFKLRMESKVGEKNAEINQLRAELDALRGRVQQDAPKKVDPLEDPDGYSSNVERRAREAAKEEFNSLLSQHNVGVNAVQSEQWLRSRSHLQDDSKAADEVAEIIAAQYSDTARQNPRAAARSAYSDWCEMKGVSPDLSSNSSLTPPRHAKPSSAGSGSSLADKTYTSDEVKRTLAGLNGKELNAYIAQVEKAAREGRYKGNFLKL